MKRKRHSEEPINCDPEGARGRHEDGRSVPQAQDQRGDLRQLKAKCGRVRSLGSQTDEGLESENARLKKLVADYRHRHWRTVRNKRDGGESVSQFPLKDKAFSTFLDQNPLFELRREMRFRFRYRSQTRSGYQAAMIDVSSKLRRRSQVFCFL